MGAVYAAFDPVTQKRVALKLLSASKKANIVALFEREYQTLASLKHPLIVEVFEYGHCELGVYYTMELLTGADLSRAAPMPWREVCACLRDVASILGVLHVRGLVHRDLSPRNLWRTPDGRLKLIDFGALAPFGVAKEIMGTPPFMPPEALRGLPLDQRSDLFALGALGYWLLTSVQAFPAKSLGELHALWAREPASPSTLVALLEGQEPPPRALEELLCALLRLDPEQRLGSTAELIDRLTTIAELPPEQGDGSVQGYLQSKAFVGRERERERILQHLAAAEGGSVQALVVEGAAGLGRTRLLEEMAMVARVAGANTVPLDARLGKQPYGVAASLVERLIATLPEARSAAQARAALFAQLSPTLRASLGVSSPPASTQTPSEARRLMQTGLQEFLLEVCKTRLIALFVDDLHAVDEESQALLSVLARAGEGHKLLLVASALREGSIELSSLLQSLHNVAVRVRLLPLTRSETHELLRSVFGHAPYLERLAERFHRLSDGNPGHCLELSQHLVRVGAAHYSEGMWVLPTDLASAQLPKSRVEGYLSRLEQVSPEARELARLISIPHQGPLPAAVCMAIRPDAGPALQELTRAGVLLESGTDYSFAHDALRETLLAELGVAERKAAHLRFADAILAGATDRSARLSAGLHCLRGGNIARGAQLQSGALREILNGGQLDLLRRDAPLLEQGFELLDAEGLDDYALASHLTALAWCGYHVDRRFSRYGDPAIATLSRILRLNLARKLRRLLGARLSLFIALVVAALAILPRRSRALSLPDTIRYLLSAVGALAGTAAVCIDSKAALRYAEAIEPLTALGKDHVATFMFSFTRYLAERSQDHLARALHTCRALVERLSGNAVVKNLPEATKSSFLSGALFSLGVSCSWRDDPECLQIADRLETFDPFSKMAADHLRAGFYGNQGNRAEAARYRQRVETHAIQLGSAWQVETWAPADILKTSLATHDALGMKRAAQELSRLAEDMPSFGQPSRFARAAYLLLRGKPAEAIPLLERDDEPQAVVGWARGRGLLARAYNALGQHERARDICRAVLARIDPEDLTFPVMNLNLPVELALAEAGLGNFALARTSLDELLAQHGPNRGPLTLASLHDAYLQVALREKDFACCAAHLERLEDWARPTGIASLLERCEVLRRDLERAQRLGDGNEDEVRLLVDDVHLITRVQLILTQTGTLLAERAKKSLQIAVELSGADDGFVVLQGVNEEASAYLNQAPGAELVVWAHRRLMAAYASDETAVEGHVDSLIDLNLNIVDGVRYCVAPLWARRDNQDFVVAALALGFRKTMPRLPGADVLRVIADHLVASVKPVS